MALMKKIALVNEYVQVPNKTAKAVELKDNDKPVSLEALGLLVNLWSYDVENWELHKTELYKRFAFNKERSVKAAWNELMAAGFIVEFKYRLGRKWDYVYYYRIKPFSPEEIEQIIAQSREEYGKISGLQNEVPKMKSSNCRPQNVELSNKELKQEKSKQKKIIKDSFVNKGISKNVENYSKEQLIKIADNYYSEFATGRWSKKQWFTLTDKITTEIIERGTKINNPENYIHSCLKGAAYKHDYKNGKVEFKFESEDGKVPFYNWLEDWDEDE